LFRSFSIYTITSILTAGLNFLLMPFLSHYIAPAGYGVLSLFNTYVMILSPLMSVVSYSLITVEYYKLKDKAEFSKLFSSIQFIPVFGFVLFLIPSLLFNSQLSSLLEIEYGNGSWLLLLPVFGLLITYNEIFLNYLVIQKKAGYYAAVSIVRSIIEIGLTCLFVAVFKWGWEGRLYAWLVVIFFLFIYGFIYFRKEKVFKFRIDKTYVKAGLIFGFPLLLHTVGKFIINQSDRIFIAKMISLDEAGIYNVGYQVGSIMLILVTAFGSSYTPFLYERLSNPVEGSQKEINRMSVGFILLLLLALVFMTLLSPWFFRRFMDESYITGTRYVFWTGLAYWFWGVYIIFSAYLFYFKKTKFLAFLAVFNVVVNIALNFLLIQKFGALGAAYATAISFFLVMLFVILKVLQLYPAAFSKKGFYLKKEF
jgi:O-antigen/teichoic acid export membrane protein